MQIILARDQTYEYNYIRDKLHVAWDSSAGTAVLSNGDLMNINEYITPSSYGDSIMHWGNADADGVWTGVDYSGRSYPNTKLKKTADLTLILIST